MPLESATTNSIRANPRTGRNNVTWPGAGEITIRQSQVNLGLYIASFFTGKVEWRGARCHICGRFMIAMEMTKNAVHLGRVFSAPALSLANLP
jgi:hypothetical protein